MEVSSHIYHIDSLLQINRMVWIIDKTNPSLPLYRISEYEFNLIKSNIFQSKNNKIKFNGQDYFLDTELINKLKVKLKKSNFDINNLSFSMREFLDPSIIENLKFEVLWKNINHLKNSNDDIYLIIPKWMDKKYDKLLDKFTDKLNENGFNIKGIYWIEEYFYDKESDQNAYKRGLIITTHLSGYKVEDSKFEEVFVDYRNVTYYENDPNIIKNLNDNIKRIFDNINKDSDKVISKNLKLNLVETTNNEYNSLIKSEVNVYTSKIVESFKNFKR